MASKLVDLAKLFFKLGVIGFGGPAAHIAMMEDEVVTRRKWMSREHFLDLVGATNLIPGPNSTEMSIHVGFHHGGWAGLIVAGASFIFPAVLITGGFAYLYVAYGQVPEVAPFLYGIKPAVIVIILNAVWKLGNKAVRNRKLAIIGAFVLIAALSGINEVLVIFGGGIAGMLGMRFADKIFSDNKNSGNLSVILPAFLFPKLLRGGALLGVLSAGAVNLAQNVSILKLFLIFLKIGAILFGSGYVLVAFLEGDLVNDLGWLTQQQLLDAIAIGQFTPGPVLSTSTFIGFQIAGLWGAVAATIGIFLPSFFFVAMINPLIPKLRRSLWASTFLDAVNVSAVGLMAAVTIKLGYGTLIDWRTWLIAAAAGVVAFRWKKVNSAWLVLGGAVAGFLMRLI